MRKILATVCLVGMLMGCDRHTEPAPQQHAANRLHLKAVSSSQLDALTGHWIYNPGWCKQQFILDQAFDLVISAEGIRLGGANRPIPGVLSAASSSPDPDQPWPGCQPNTHAESFGQLTEFTFTSPNLTLIFHLGATFLLMEDDKGAVYELKKADSLALSDFDPILSHPHPLPGAQP
ncbi:hypothetical protein [Pseudoalteromonas rubra]|uniref:Uncharacterized protein n=1 Tax=Pseudoalteromonas rubra TaxID=43658 RepID=A0A0U2XE16_9GAMM|nr:hypothetical protein [Pseudoalteromonas rubra]ALU46116.1 hypothetical protein AT705_24450 [Pseudoalteromonas rubra]